MKKFIAILAALLVAVGITTSANAQISSSHIPEISSEEKARLIEEYNATHALETNQKATDVYYLNDTTMIYILESITVYED